MTEIIVFGGSFDPIHIGHLIMAEQALSQRRAEKVLFIPTFDPPHKKDYAVTSFLHRYIMVNNAIEGNNNFEASDVERWLPVPSYTLNTIESLRDRYPSEVCLSLLIGADMLKDMPNWHKPQSILKSCNILVVGRSGYDVNKKSLEQNSNFNFIEAPEINVSSSMIRKYVRSRRSILYLVEPAVENYILTKGLYG